MDHVAFQFTRSASARFHRTLAETLPVGVLLTDAEGRPVYVNEQAERITGYTVEEIIADMWCMWPEKPETDFVFEQAFLRGNPASNYQTMLKRKDGSMFWASLSWRPVTGDNGEFAGVCAVMVDISQTKSTEEALKRADERYRELAESATDIFFEWDLEGVITYASSSVRQLGYTPDEMIGRSVFDLVDPAEKEASYARRKKQLNDLESIRHEIWVYAKDGSLRCLEAQVDVVIEGGRPAKICAVHRDITARKMAEQALRESEQRYKSIVENSNDLILLTLPDGTIAYASPACKAINGYEPEELIAENIWVIHPDDTDRMRAAFKLARRGEARSSIEYRIVTKLGDTRWVSHSWSPVYVGDALQTVVSVVRDITERKRSDDALHQAHTELEQAYQIQREFINNVTHEVRTPLTAVKGYAEMLMEGIAGPVSDEQAVLLKKVLTSSQHLLDVVNGVLQIARLKSGKIAANPRACNPVHIVEKAISAVAPQAEQKGLSIVVEPGTSGNLGIYDEEKLVIIITNLLTNAIKFTEAGSINVMVTCDTSGARIVVADTGMGISEPDLAVIFDEFQQLDYPRKHKPTGFGIGLAIVATMVEAIGASLTVSSVPGLGTAFTLSVPVLEA